MALSQFSPADLDKLSSSVVQEFLSQLLVKVRLHECCIETMLGWWMYCGNRHTHTSLLQVKKKKTFRRLRCRWK